MSAICELVLLTVLIFIVHKMPQYCPQTVYFNIQGEDNILKYFIEQIPLKGLLSCKTQRILLLIKLVSCIILVNSGSGIIRISELNINLLRKHLLRILLVLLTHADNAEFMRVS